MCGHVVGYSVSTGSAETSTAAASAGEGRAWVAGAQPGMESEQGGKGSHTHTHGNELDNSFFLQATQRAEEDKKEILTGIKEVSCL